MTATNPVAGSDSPVDPHAPRQSRFPHPLVLILGCVVVAAILTWILPAGELERRLDPATGRMAVVAGTYHAVAASPVGPWATLVAVQRGIVAAASVVAFIFLIGGALSVVDATGALGRAVTWLVAKLERRPALVIPASSLFFFAGGLTFGMADEIVAFIPMLLLVVGRLGYDRITAVAMSLGSAAIGVAVSPMDPFAVALAQKVAGLPLLSGAGFRMLVALPMIALWVGWTVRRAERSRVPPSGLGAPAGGPATVAAAEVSVRGGRTAIIFGIMAATFVTLVWGVLRFDWGIDELAGLFLGAGILCGLLGGLGVRGTAESLVRGFGNMAFAALLVGFSRAILLVLEQGKIIDTIITGLAIPLAHLPTTVAAEGMLAVQSLVHIVVPSTSGHAMITMPILAPLGDILGLSRQVAVLAYQYGAGLMENIIPTNGALMAVLVLCGVPYNEWLRFAWKVTAVLFVMAAGAIALAVAIGLQ